MLSMASFDVLGLTRDSLRNSVEEAGQKLRSGDLGDQSSEWYIYAESVSRAVGNIKGHVLGHILFSYESSAETDSGDYTLWRCRTDTSQFRDTVRSAGTQWKGRLM